MRNEFAVALILTIPLWFPLVLFILSFPLKEWRRGLSIGAMGTALLAVAGSLFLRLFTDWPDYDRTLLQFYLPVAVELTVAFWCGLRLFRRRSA